MKMPRWLCDLWCRVAHKVRKEEWWESRMELEPFGRATRARVIRRPVFIACAQCSRVILDHQRHYNFK